MLSIGNEEAKPESDEEETQEELAGKEKKEAGEDYAELREQMLRLAAEFDNYKKRVKKDLDNAEDLGKAALIKDMLPIIDEFELAMLALNEAKDKNIAKGVEMLYSNLIGILKKEGLTEIGTDGTFDPYKHEIMMLKKDDRRGDGAILEVVKKGYLFKDRLLRPASVIISKKAKDEKETKNND